MNNDIQSLLLSEMFVPNKRITVSGEHFFADKDLYTNFYGMSFFSSLPGAERNPYIAHFYRSMPGIIDEFLSDGMPGFPTRPAPPGELLTNILNCIDKKYITSHKPEAPVFKNSFSCSYEAEVMHDGKNLNIRYGTVLPNTLCITEDYAITAQLPFSPFTYISLLRGQRTLQSAEYSLSREPLMPPEDVIIDFSVTAKKLSVDLDSDFCGRIDLEFSLDVGAAKCENTKLTFDISPMPDTQP